MVKEYRLGRAGAHRPARGPAGSAARAGRPQYPHSLRRGRGAFSSHAFRVPSGTPRAAAKPGLQGPGPESDAMTVWRGATGVLARHAFLLIGWRHRRRSELDRPGRSSPPAPGGDRDA
jgi:hypothetical protein